MLTTTSACLFYTLLHKQMASSVVPHARGFNVLSAAHRRTQQLPAPHPHFGWCFGSAARENPPKYEQGIESHPSINVTNALPLHVTDTIFRLSHARQMPEETLDVCLSRWPKCPAQPAIESSHTLHVGGTGGRCSDTPHCRPLGAHGRRDKQVSPCTQAHTSKHEQAPTKTEDVHPLFEAQPPSTVINPTYTKKNRINTKHKPHVRADTVDTHTAEPTQTTHRPGTCSRSCSTPGAPRPSSVAPPWGPPCVSPAPRAGPPSPDPS